MAALVYPCFVWPVSYLTAWVTFTKPTTHSTTSRTGAVASIDAYLTTLLADLITAGLTGATIKIGVDGRISIGATIAWTWKATTSASAKTILGFIVPSTGVAVAVDAVAVLESDTFGMPMYVVTAPSPHPSGWYPTLPPKRDSLPTEDWSQNVITRSMSGRIREYADVHHYARVIAFAYVPRDRTYAPDVGYQPSTFQSMFWNARGVIIRYLPDYTVRGTYFQCTMDKETSQKFDPKRMMNSVALYEFTVGLWKYV